MNKIMQENIEDLCKPALYRAIAAEFIGTLLLVLLGCGAIDNNNHGVVNGATVDSAVVVQVALAFGLVYGTLVWCFNHVSGGHFNPAVSVAAVICRRASVVRGLLYILAQLVGAIAGAALLRWFSVGGYTIGVTMVRSPLVLEQGFGIEFFITFLLVFVILASTDEKRSDLAGSSPLTIGLAVVAGHLFAYNYTMASMNPARTFGPALVQNVWAHHWVYWVGPLVGGLFAALAYEYIFAAGASYARTKKFVLKHRRPAEKPTAVNSDEMNSSKAGLIEAPTTDNEGDAVVEMEKIEEEKKEEEPAEVKTE